MRGILIFVCGALIGLMLETDRPERSDPGVFMLNHISINVEDMDESLDFYTRTMGFEIVHSLTNEQGQVGIVFLDTGNNSFLKLTSAGDVGPLGFTHLSVQVNDLETVKEMYASRGARLTETFVGRNEEARSFFTDPQGIPIELFEYPPESELGNILAGG